GEDRRQRPVAALLDGLAVQPGAGPLDGGVRLVANDTRVVAGRGLLYVTGLNVELRSVVHRDVERAGQRVRDMSDLAAGCANDRHDVDSPVPARRAVDPADRGLVEVDDLQLAGAERSRPIRSGKGLALEAG